METGGSPLVGSNKMRISSPLFIESIVDQISQL